MLLSRKHLIFPFCHCLGTFAITKLKENNFFQLFGRKEKCFENSSFYKKKAIKISHRDKYRSEPLVHITEVLCQSPYVSRRKTTPGKSVCFDSDLMGQKKGKKSKAQTFHFHLSFTLRYRPSSVMRRQGAYHNFWQKNWFMITLLYKDMQQGYWCKKKDCQFLFLHLWLDVKNNLQITVPALYPIMTHNLNHPLSWKFFIWK